MPTLHKYFRLEIATASSKANAQMAESLYRQGTGAKPNVAATIFWLKARAGWRERIVLEDGGMADDPATLSDEQIEERITKLRRATVVSRTRRAADAVH